MSTKSVHDMKLHLFLFNKVLKWNCMRGLPAMTAYERKVYKELLFSLKGQAPLNILEYGSGYSTIYFAKFLRDNNIEFHIDAVENHAGWCERVRSLIAQNGLQDKITVHLFEFERFCDKPGWDWKVSPEQGKFAPKTKEEVEYINLPLTLKKKFDFIVVDARFRRRCLEVAAQCLKPKGAVLLHDAEKEQYHCSMKLYRYAKFFNSGPYYPFEPVRHKMWIGSLDNPLVTSPELEKIIP